MSWHLIVHYLDDLRQQGASTFSWNSVRSNLGAWPYQAGLTFLGAYAVWPKVRQRFDGWIKGHLAAHHEALKQHITDEIQRLK